MNVYSKLLPFTDIRRYWCEEHDIFQDNLAYMVLHLKNVHDLTTLEIINVLDRADGFAIKDKEAVAA